nr:retrovirus-related Pol polyprotein from transposon TNT 1-94 [Tanacetum cinerariifolium]
MVISSFSTDDELTEKELKQIEADDQATQTILLGLPEDIYAAVDSCETAQEIWLRVQQMMKGSDIGIQEKKAKLFNDWERANVSKPIPIPNEEFSDDSTPSVARKFLNEVKSTIVTLQRVVKHRMTLDTHNWSSSAHQELHKILKDEIFPIVNQVDARVQNFEINFLKEAAKFVRDFKSLAKEADESLAKHKALELEIKRLLREVVSQDIMSIVQNNSVGDTSNLHTELERTKERFENCIIKKENEYAKLWNDWNKKCEECKFDKILYDKAYNDMQQKIERLQAQLGDLKGKVLNYAKENVHLKTTYKNLFDSIPVTRTQTKTIIDSLQNKLHDTIYENSKLRAQLFDKVSEQKDTTRGMSANTKFAKQSILGKPPSSSRTKLINPFKTSKEEKYVPNKVRARVRTTLITVSQPHVITKKVVNSDSNGLSSKGVDNTAKTKRPQPGSNTKNDRVPSASKSSYNKNKGVEVEEHPRNLLLSKNKKHMSSESNNVKLATQNVKSKVVCAMCKQCLISINHDHMTGNLKLLINFVWVFLGTVRFGNDHIAAILDFGNLQWGNILITRVYFIEGLRHNLFSVGQFCDSNLEVAFRRNTCFVRNLEGVDLLSENHTTNLYTIKIHEMASTSLICLMARASSTKSWLWHQRLSHLNFDTINDLAKNDLVTSLPKFKYHKEHNFPYYEQGESKRASHPPKLVPNSRQRLHLLHMDLYGLMRISSINGKRKPDISFLHVFGALCYPKNDHEDIGKLGSKGDIGFFIGYSGDSCAYRVFNRRSKKIMETMNVTFDELSAMAFEQSSSKPRLQSMTSGQISLGLDLTYAPSTITTQQPTEDTVPTPTNSSSQATNFPNSSQDVDGLKPQQQQHPQQQGNQAPLQPETVADNVPNAMFDANTFVNPFATPSTSAAESSSLQYVDPSNMHTFYQPYPHEFQWTKDHPLKQDSGFELTGFSDADYAGCKDTFKSTSGGAQLLGENLVSWSSKKQDYTTLSTAEAEYVSVSTCCAQVLWMRTQLTDYGFHFNKIPIYCDLKSAIAISCNSVQHSRTKHIAVRYHFIKEYVEKGTIELYFVKTDYQLAGIFTKALPTYRFNYLVRCLGMRSLSPKELDRLAKSQ